jgi:hypothetical protein
VRFLFEHSLSPRLAGAINVLEGDAGTKSITYEASTPIKVCRILCGFQASVETTRTPLSSQPIRPSAANYTNAPHGTS